MDKKINKHFLAKLKSMLIKLEDVRTVDGRDLMVDGEIEVGKDIMLLDDSGEYVPAPSGEYDTGDVVLIVDAGRITEIREKTVEETTEEVTERVTEEIIEEELAEPTAEEIDNLRAENDRLREENNDLRARIAELEGKLNQMAAVPPADEDKEDSVATLTNRFIQSAHKRQ